MNKTVLTVAILALVVSLVNTALLVQLIGQLKGIADTVEPVAKDIDKIQKIWQQPKTLLPELPRIKPFESTAPREKRQDGSADADPEPKVLPKPPVPLPKP